MIRWLQEIQQRPPGKQIQLQQAQYLLKAFTDPGFELHISQQQVHAQGRHDLCHNRVLTGAQECFDFEVLFDPFEEQFYLPTLFVDVGYGLRRPVELIGDEDIMLTRFRVTVANPAKRYECLSILTQRRIGSIKAILPETQLYWNALYFNILPGLQRIIAAVTQ